MLNRNHLALFHAVAEEGGFGRGARRLRISQPAVSAQISELESVLGFPLFHRLGRGVQLTDAGEVLAGYVRRIAQLELEAEAAMQEMADLRRGHIALGASTTIAAYLLPPVIAQFRKLWPDITVNLDVGNTTYIQQRLVDGSLSIGLTEGFADDPQLFAEIIRTDELVAVAAPSHPILLHRRITPRVFLQYPLIVREAGSGTRQVIERALAAKGMDFNPAYVLSGTETVKGAVAAGLGVAFVSSLAIAGDIKQGRLATVKISGLSIRRPLHLLHRRGQKATPAVEAFFSILGTTVV